MLTFFQNGDEQINGDGAPNLSAHGVGAGAIKGFDAQMLLDPFEEQFDPPAATIQLSDGQSRPGEVVGQEDEGFADEGIALADAPQCVNLLGEPSSLRVCSFPDFGLSSFCSFPLPFVKCLGF